MNKRWRTPSSSKLEKKQKSKNIKLLVYKLVQAGGSSGWSSYCRRVYHNLSCILSSSLEDFRGRDDDRRCCRNTLLFQNFEIIVVAFFYWCGVVAHNVTGAHSCTTLDIVACSHLVLFTVITHSSRSSSSDTSAPSLSLPLNLSQ
jgi:hypothetical protein